MPLRGMFKHSGNEPEPSVVIPPRVERGCIPWLFAKCATENFAPRNAVSPQCGSGSARPGIIRRSFPAVTSWYRSSASRLVFSALQESHVVRGNVHPHLAAASSHRISPALPAELRFPPVRLLVADLDFGRVGVLVCRAEQLVSIGREVLPESMLAQH